jgi:hypothetical protein
VVGSCELENEPSGYIKTGNLLKNGAIIGFGKENLEFVLLGYFCADTANRRTLRVEEGWQLLRSHFCRLVESILTGG